MSEKRPLNGFFVCIYYLVNLVAGILHPVTIIGRENLPEHGALLCPNHNSNWDPVLVALKVPVNYRLHIMAKKELFCNKVFDWVLRKLGAFPVDRGEGDIEAVKTALKAIKSGDNLLIFPEGTRNENQELTQLLPFHEGSLKIAQKSGCPVIPVAITGTAEIFEQHLPFVKPSHVCIRYGEPIYIKELPAEKRKFPGAYTRDVIEGMLKEMKEEQEQDK